MKFSINDRVFRVRFIYSDGKVTGPKSLENVGNKRIITTVEIQEKIGDNWALIATGKSIRNPMDPFTKDTGRKKALKNAFRTLPLNWFSQQQRLDFWHQYFASHKCVKPDWFLKLTEVERDMEPETIEIPSVQEKKPWWKNIFN